MNDKNKNIRYIRRYISDIGDVQPDIGDVRPDIGDVRHDIGDDRYIGFGSIYHENIMSVAHACVSLIFR